MDEQCVRSYMHDAIMSYSEAEMDSANAEDCIVGFIDEFVVEQSGNLR